MAKFMRAAGESGDLFGDRVIPGRSRPIEPGLSPALCTARVLCRQLRKKPARPDKQRIAHLICLNLLAMLRDDAQHSQHGS